MTIVKRGSSKIHTARVTNPVAVPYDPETDEWCEPIRAEDFDPKTHGHCEFYCPDCLEKGEKARLKKPSSAREQHIRIQIYNRETGEPVIDPQTGQKVAFYQQWHIPAHFSLWAGQKHGCDKGIGHERLRHISKKNGGFSYDSNLGLYTYNLDIPTGTAKPPTQRKPSVLKEAFPKERNARKSSAKSYPKRSEGIRSVAELAKLLEASAFDPEMRAGQLMRLGNEIIALSDLYVESPAALFKQRYKQPDTPLLCRFKPIGNRKFWQGREDGRWQITGQAEKTAGRDGNIYYPSMRLILTVEAYREFHKQFKTGQKSFLVFADDVTANLNSQHFGQAANWETLRTRKPENRSVFVDIAVNNPAQFIPWSPPCPQATLDLGFYPENLDL